jgi:hypothetical protein
MSEPLEPSKYVIDWTRLLLVLILVLAVIGLFV